MPANPPALFGDIGSVKAALKTLFLGPDFERELVAVEGRFADGLVLPRLTERMWKTTNAAGVPEQYPAAEIIGETTAPDNAVDYADQNTHQISVVFWVNDDDEEKVTKLCERYVLATRKMLRIESLMPMIGCLPVQRGMEEYGVVSRKPGLAHPYVNAAALTFFVTTIE